MFTLIFLFQSCNSLHFNSIRTDSENNRLHIKSEIIPLQTYDDIGDFIPFTPSGSYPSYDDTNNKVRFGGILVGWTAKATLDLIDINSLIVRNVSFTMLFNTQGGGGTYNFTAYIKYTDLTVEIIASRIYTGALNYQKNYNSILNESKTIDKFEWEIDSNGGYLAGGFEMTNLKFWGYLPEISNISYNSNVKTNEETSFFAILTRINSNLNQNITFQYIDSGNFKEKTMETDWVGNDLYHKSEIFSTIGNYRFIITARSGWNVSQSDFYYFQVGNYPLNSYLSLFSSLDGFPLDSKDFKIYSGENEEVSLVNFRTFFGNWSSIYGSPVNASLIDNYVKFSANSNGLQTNFENGDIIDTITVNTLIFQAKVLNNLRLVVIYNPQYFEKDYYIDFTSDMINSWYEIEIPFFLFNQYNNVTNDWLSQLGFWISNGTIEISNVRAAIHYNKTYLQEASIQLNMTASTILETLVSQDYLNSSVLTFDSIEYYWNSTSNITDGYNCTGASFENVSIESNSSIQTNVTGHFQGEYSFLNDADGSNPAGWTVQEGGGTVDVVSNYQGHEKVVYMSDTSSGSSVQLYQTIEDQIHGSVEYYVLWTTLGQYDAFPVLTHGATYCVYVWCQDTNRFQYWDGAVKRTMYFYNGSQVVRQTGVWYRMKMDFDCVTDTWNWYIATEFEPDYQIMYEDASHSDYTFQFATAVDHIDTIKFYSYIGGLTKMYVDSIDYSFSTGYENNRISYLIDCDSYYISDVIDFNQSYEISNISIDSMIPTNTTLDVYVSDNSTGLFDTWMNYSEYLGNETRFLKYKVLLNNLNSIEVPLFDNISFNLTTYTYNLSQNFNISYFSHSYASIWNSTSFINIKTNDSTGTNNLSIYKFNESQYFNRTFNHSSYDLLNFTFDNNTIFDPDNNLTTMFQIYGNSSNPFQITINLINCTTYYNKTLYSGEYNISLLSSFEDLFLYYFNNNSLDLDLCLYNGSEYFKQIDLENSTSWENFNQSVNATWTYLNFNFSSYENESFWIREVFEIQETTYRLLNESNRQNPNAITFDSASQGLAILDYFGNTLYRETLDYTSFIDIALPIVTFTIYNWYNESIYATIERGLGVSIEIIVPPMSSYSLRIFATSYQLWVRNQNLTTLLLTEFSPDSSENIIFEIGEQQRTDLPDAWNIFYDFITSPLGIFLVILECILGVITVWDLVYNTRQWLAARKREKEKDKTNQKESLRKDTEEELLIDL